MYPGYSCQFGSPLHHALVHTRTLHDVHAFSASTDPERPNVANVLAETTIDNSKSTSRYPLLAWAPGGRDPREHTALLRPVPGCWQAASTAPSYSPTIHPSWPQPLGLGPYVYLLLPRASVPGCRPTCTPAHTPECSPCLPPCCPTASDPTTSYPPRPTPPHTAQPPQCASSRLCYSPWSHPA